MRTVKHWDGLKEFIVDDSSLQISKTGQASHQSEMMLGMVLNFLPALTLTFQFTQRHSKRIQTVSLTLTEQPP